MGQMLGGLWDRAQGKRHVRRISDKVFDQFAENNALAVKNLHVATLMVYFSLNKQFLTPYKDPPSKKTIEDQVQNFQTKGTQEINRDEFHALIMGWEQRDLKFIATNRIILAILAAPYMAIITKNAAKRVPQIRDVAERVPTPVISSAYAMGLILLQDVQRA